MTTNTRRIDHVTSTGTVLATRLNQTRAVADSGALWRATVVVGDLLGIMVIGLCIPFAIMAIGTPIALCLRLLLWMAGWL